MLNIQYSVEAGAYQVGKNFPFLTMVKQPEMAREVTPDMMSYSLSIYCIPQEVN